MEYLPGNDRYLDPPEEAQCPPCSECGEEMWRRDTWTFGCLVDYECRNPDCDECAKEYKKVERDDD